MTSRLELDHASVTLWLQRLGAQGEAPPAGASGPVEQLFAVLYEELRTIARRQMRREGPEHTLSATALAHEAYFRLAGQTQTRWRDRSHFLAVASTMMRRILVNHALARRAKKRGGDEAAVTLTEFEQVGAGGEVDVVAVHDALESFEKIDARAARVVELRFFGGMEIAEIASALETSPATVKRDWTIARGWLRRELASMPGGA